VIVSGSGRRLRDIQLDPAANLGVVAINIPMSFLNDVAAKVGGRL
jgi:hypothetical protein